MDHVQKVQAISNMALELKSKGLVDSTEEAIKQAQELVDKGQSIETMMRDDNMDEEKLTKQFSMVDERINKVDQGLNSKIGTIISKMNEMIKEIHSMQEQMKELKTTPKVAEPVKQESAAESHPRGGDVDPNAVDIHKYFGYKR